jgi:pyruvate dehydrogenase E2 component (dihydrolipoamide acetyltransferase)
VVRKLGRELGVDLARVIATGPRGRIQKEDLHAYVKAAVAKAESAPAAGAVAGSGIPAVPEVDFGAFGDIRTEKLTKVQKVTSQAMTRAWLNVPHVTQFDDIDITELEKFRKGMKEEAAKAGVRLTPLPFLLKACAAALKKHPLFNSSLHHDGEHIVYKDYVHIGVAVDTPNGLMVPVIRDVDKKGLYELAEESVALAKAAKDRKLKPADMKGGCFTISSLGGMGGKGFTPIVSPPEVGILGVSRLSTQPVWNGSEFVPRQMLPLSLSYDHRVVNGADAGRFFADLSAYLNDVRRLLV